jgi:short-subunit dehydrogenase
VIELDGSQALITGASSGIGREFARQLGGRASLVVLVARREERLREVRDELIAQNPSLRVEIHPSDLSQRAAVNDLLRWIEAQKLALDLLVNNAGLGDLGSFATADPERLETMMQVNMVALTQLTRALLPAMIERGRGGILNVSSSAGFLPMPNFAVYAATKAYVTSFSQGLRLEVRDAGVNVLALCPGPVRTEFGEVARRSTGRTGPPRPDFFYVPVEQVVAEGLRALDQNRPVLVPGYLVRLSMFLVRHIPRPVLRLAGRVFAKGSRST